jgi:hypothetical protein
MRPTSVFVMTWTGLSKELGVVALRREARNVGGTLPSLSSLLTKTFAYSESAPPGAD